MFKDKNILYLILIGIAYRLILFAGFYTSYTIFPDSSGYIALSELLSNIDITGYGGQRSPGYPLLISLALENLYVVVVYQFIFGIVTSVLWYKILLYLKFAPRQGMLIAIILQSFLNVFFFETAILVESLVLFFISLLVYLLLSGFLRKVSYPKEICFSLIVGYLVLIKPFFAFLPFLIFGYYVLGDFKWGNLLGRKLIVFIFPLMAYFGWSYVNKVNTGHFVSTTFLGLNMAQNVVRFAEKGPHEYRWISEPYVEAREEAIAGYKDIAMSIWFARAYGAYDQYNLDFPDLSAEMGKYAKATIKENKLDYIRQVVFYSWVDFWKPVIYWNYDKFNFPYVNKAFLGLWYIQYALLLILRIAFILLIPYYIINALKLRKVTAPFIFVSLVLATSVLQALVTYGTNDRFSFPFEFLMIMTVCYFLKEKQLFNGFFKLDRHTLN